MKNFMDFITENQNTIFRYLVFNKYNIWTPEQQKNRYCDESVYLDFVYTFAKILDAYDTPNGLLIVFDILDPDDDWRRCHRQEYRLLSDIALECFDIDNIEDEDDTVQ